MPVFFYLFVFNLFIWFINELFGVEKVSCFSCLVEDMSQTISFKGLFSTVLFLLNKSNSGLSETVTYNPKSISLKRVAVLFLHLFLVHSVFSSWRNNIPIKLWIFYCVRRCPNFCFHYCFFQYLMFVNEGNYLESVVTVISVSVIWSSSTGLYVIIIKSLVSTKLYSFYLTSAYLKAVAFWAITFLEQKSFLKIVDTCDSLCSQKVLFISYKLSSHTIAQSF